MHDFTSPEVTAADHVTCVKTVEFTDHILPSSSVNDADLDLINFIAAATKDLAHGCHKNNIQGRQALYAEWLLITYRLNTVHFGLFFTFKSAKNNVLNTPSCTLIINVLKLPTNLGH